MSIDQPIPQDDLDRLIAGTHWAPHAVLGPHATTIDGRPGFAIRAWLPQIKDVAAVSDSILRPMTRLHEEGLYEALFPDTTLAPSYKLRVTGHTGTVVDIHDPYAFPPLLTDFELHLFTEGTLYKAYNSFGAHVRTVQGIPGVHFVLWAPNAARVSVIGDFNGWNGLCHPMASRGPTGLWELFMPDLPESTLYKYEIRSREHDMLLRKADPYAVASELRPRTASIVHDLSGYTWHDGTWKAAITE